MLTTMNRIKNSGDGVALQITKAARSAGFVEETEDGNVTRRAEVRVFAVDGVLVVFDLERMSTAEISEIVISAASDTDSVYRAMDATVKRAGNGFQVQLLPATDAGFEVGDRAGTHPATGMVVIAKGDGPQARQASRLAADLVTIRYEQK